MRLSTRHQKHTHTPKKLLDRKHGKSTRSLCLSLASPFLSHATTTPHARHNTMFALQVAPASVHRLRPPLAPTCVPVSSFRFLVIVSITTTTPIRSINQLVSHRSSYLLIPVPAVPRITVIFQRFPALFACFFRSVLHRLFLALLPDYFSISISRCFPYIYIQSLSQNEST